MLKASDLPEFSDEEFHVQNRFGAIKEVMMSLIDSKSQYQVILIALSFLRGNIVISLELLSKLPLKSFSDSISSKKLLFEF